MPNWAFILIIVLIVNALVAVIALVPALIISKDTDSGYEARDYFSLHPDNIYLIKYNGNKIEATYLYSKLLDTESSLYYYEVYKEYYYFRKSDGEIIKIRYGDIIKELNRNEAKV